MVVSAVVQQNAKADSYAANSAANTLTARFKNEANYKVVNRGDKTIKGSTQGYISEVTYGSDTNRYLAEAAVLKNGKDTVVIQIVYPDALDSSYRSTAEDILNSLVIN